MMCVEIEYKRIVKENACRENNKIKMISSLHKMTCHCA